MILLKNIKKLYNGSTDSPSAIKENQSILIGDDGMILDVKPGNIAIETPDGTDMVDCSEWTATPGIIDCHGHITILGLATKEIDIMNGPTQLVYIERILNATLIDGGVTTMRDIGGATNYMKQLIENGVMVGPRLKIAICMLSTTGGHADFRGPDRCHATLNKLFIEAPGRPSSVVDGPWECRKRVREVVACGADVIKVCASSGVASPSDHIEDREFTNEELAAICDEAAGRGLKVAAHAHSESGIQAAIDCGVHDIQHISFMNEKQVDEAYKRGSTVTPTSWIIDELLLADNLDPFVMEKAKKAAEHHSKSVEYAIKGGMRILAGSDPVLPGMHGRNYMEIVHLIKDGMSCTQAWFAATGAAAQEIGQADSGQLVAGKRADILMAKGDIINKPQLLDQGALVEVFKDGIPFRGGSGLKPNIIDRSVVAALPDYGGKQTLN